MYIPSINSFFKLKLLHKLYTTTKFPSTFEGIDPLYNEAKKYDPTIRKKDGKWIFDFQKLSRHNNGNKCILVGIDVLSKRLFCSPTKSKGYKDMKVAFDSLLGQMPMLPHRIYSDRGTEFIMREKIKEGNQTQVKDYFKEKEIQKFKSSTKTRPPSPNAQYVISNPGYIEYFLSTRLSTGQNTWSK